MKERLKITRRKLCNLLNILLGIVSIKYLLKQIDVQ